MKYIVACNWKMLPADYETAKKTILFHKKLASENPGVEIISLVPNILFGLFANKKDSVHYGVQDISEFTMGTKSPEEFSEGAFTGENSPLLVKDMGGTHTIVGHSERRERYQETSIRIAEKAYTALAVGITPIVCFGETKRDDKGNYIDELSQQLLESLSGIDEKMITKVLLAYEPVWAIGTLAKRAITNEELFSTLILIKKILTEKYGKARADKVKILYGGSVKKTNVQELASVPGVSGFLIGGATHSKSDLKDIISACK